MPEPNPSTYSPVVDPRDFASVPRGLGPNDELHVPVIPPRGRLRPPSWMRQLGEQHRLVLSFCTSDRQLLRWDLDPGSAERYVASVAPEAALTLDVPFYRFMTAPTRERALARSAAAIQRAVRHWDPHGIEVIPLIKGLLPEEWAPQLRTAAEFGLSRVAQYVREQRLENDEAAIGSFVRHARQLGLRPMLGASRPAPPGVPSTRRRCITTSLRVDDACSDARDGTRPSGPGRIPTYWAGSSCRATSRRWSITTSCAPGRCSALRRLFLGSGSTSTEW